MRAISNKGRVVDFSMLMAKNETMVAGGNARLNARGDLLGVGGKVVKTAAEFAQDYHRNVAQAAVDYASIKDIEQEILTPQEAVAKIEAQQAAKPPEKAAPARKRSSTQSED